MKATTPPDDEPPKEIEDCDHQGEEDADNSATTTTTTTTERECEILHDHAPSTAVTVTSEAASANLCIDGETTKDESPSLLTRIKATTAAIEPAAGMVFVDAIVAEEEENGENSCLATTPIQHTETTILDDDRKLAAARSSGSTSSLNTVRASRPGAVAVAGGVDGEEAPVEPTEAAVDEKREQQHNTAAAPSGSTSSLNSDRAYHPGAVAVAAGTIKEEMPVESTESTGKQEAADSTNDTSETTTAGRKEDGPSPTVAVVPETLSSEEVGTSNDDSNDNMQQESSIPAHVAPSPVQGLDDIPTTLDHDEEANRHSTTMPMVEAELVTPPVEAYRVSIDEDPRHDSMSAIQRSTFEIEQTAVSNEDSSSLWTDLRKFRCALLTLLAVLVIVVVTIAVVMPLVLTRGGGGEVVNDEKNGDFGKDIDTITPFPDIDTITPVPGIPIPEIETEPPFNFPYYCYTSTLEIMEAQRGDEHEDAVEAYIICPNTIIQVGTFQDPAANDFRFVDGDYPLLALRENVTIQCGIDGNVENNCILNGGFMQVLTTQKVPTPDGIGIDLNNTIDNFLIRGMTFTGQPTNSGPFTGLSVTLSHPGENIRFEGCLWTNLSAQNGLIDVSRNYWQQLLDLPLADNSIHVTFSNCRFENIIYDMPLLHVKNQAVVLEQCVFRYVLLSLLLQQFCARVALYPEDVIFDDGCAGLLYCGSGSTCSLEDICVEDFEHYGPGIVFMTDRADLEYKNLYIDHYDNSSISTPPDGDDYCELGVAYVNSSRAMECSNIFAREACPLRL